MANVTLNVTDAKGLLILPCSYYRTDRTTNKVLILWLLPYMSPQQCLAFCGSKLSSSFH
jgi:hypothetical protein